MRLNFLNIKDKNYKVHRDGFSKRVISAVLIPAVTMSILLTGCSYKNVKVDNHDNHSTYISEQISESADVSIVGEEFDYGNITLSSDYYNYFVNYLNDCNIYFREDDIFSLNGFSYLEESRSSVHDNYSYNVIRNGKVNVDILLDIVVKNNKPFKETTKHYMYLEIENQKEIRNVLSIVVDAINYEMDRGLFNEEELRELDCKLSNLKVFESTGVSNASLTDELVLLVNPNMIKMVEIASGNDNTFRNVVYHETQHIFQMDCPHRAEQNYLQAGLARGYGDDNLNPYNWLWSSEAAAEKEVVNRTGDEPLTYTYITQYMDSMDLSVMLNPSANSTTEIEDSSIHRDIERFYELMNPNDVLGNEELVKLMFTFGVAQNVYDFRDDLEKYYGVPFSDDDYKELRHDYKEKFCEGLVKVFYANLALAIKNNTVSMNDVYYLIKLFEGDMNYHLEYSKNLTDRNIEFVKFYNNIQGKFFNALAISSGREDIDIYNDFERYDMYYEVNGLEYLNAPLKWIDNEKRKYLDERAKSDTVMFTETIYSISLKNNGFIK